MFVPHRFNVQLEGHSLRLAAITKCGWAHVTLRPGVNISSALVVEHDGVEETFGVAQAGEIVERIDQARA